MAQLCGRGFAGGQRAIRKDGRGAALGGRHLASTLVNTRSDLEPCCGPGRWVDLVRSV